jgi:hypothetical protein
MIKIEFTIMLENLDIYKKDNEDYLFLENNVI